MDPNAVLAKTPQGHEELSQLGHDLPRTLRHALILVDGRSTVAELEVKGSIIPDFVAALGELVARGLVAPRGGDAAAAPPQPHGPSGKSLQGALVAVAGSILGDRAGRVVKKLEDAGQSREALAAAVEASFKLIRLTIDEAQAEEFRRAAKDVLAKGG